MIPWISEGKQKRSRSTNQPQLRSETTIATIEAEQFLSTFQQLASKSNWAIFNKNINRVSKIPKNLTSTLPTFDGKSEKFEQLKGLF